MLILAGLAIYALPRERSLVEVIAHGVLTGALAERRRTPRRSRRSRDHYIICGYGRVGRRVADEFRDAGVAVRRPRLQPGRARARAGAGRPVHRGQRHEGRGPRGAGLARARGLVASSDSDVDNLYITLSARAQRPGPLRSSRGPPTRTRPRRCARRRRPRRAAVRDRRPGDGEARAEAAGGRRSSTSSRGTAAPTSASRRSRSRASCPQAGQTIRELRVRHETGALIVALRKAGRRPSTRRPDPDARARRRRRADRASAREHELRALEELFAASRGRCRLARSSGSRRARRGGRRRSVELERPASPSTATTRRTSRSSSRRPRKRAAARARARSSPPQATALPDVERAEVAGPGFVNLLLATAWFGEALARDPRGGRELRRRLRRRRGAGAGRDGLGEPDRADHRRRGSERRVRRLASPGCSSSPATRSSASTTTTTPARRWSSSARRSRRSGEGSEPPEDGYQGDYIARARRSRGRPGAADARADRGDARAVPDPLRLLGAPERARRAAARSSCRGSTRTRRTGPSGRARRRTATRRTACSSAPPKSGEPTYRAADIVYLVDKLERGFDRAIYVLGADHHGTRNWYAAVARMLGYDPERVEVLLYQLVHLTRGRASRRRCRSAAATSSSSTSSSTRSASTPRAGTSSTAAPTRRSRSTSTSPPRRRRRTRSTTSSTRTRGSPGSCATPRGRRGLVAALRRRSAPEERDLVKRLAEFPDVVAEAVERRGPHALPTYAIRVADDFHRFYHHHRVLESEAAGVPARPLPRDADA